MVGRRSAAPWLSALLVVAAAAGLLPARLRQPLDPLLGPPRAVPVVAGTRGRSGGGRAVLGAATRVAVAVTGFAGVLLATVPPAAC